MESATGPENNLAQSARMTPEYPALTRKSVCSTCASSVPDTTTEHCLAQPQAYATSPRPTLAQYRTPRSTRLGLQ
eukprot:2040845-Rhodomonas_salina.3